MQVHSCQPAELELEFYYQNASTADATLHVPIANTILKQHLHLVASWLDLASILLYLVMVLFIILYQQRVLDEVSDKTVTVTDYSVQVWDLPKVCNIKPSRCDRPAPCPFCVDAFS